MKQFIRHKLSLGTMVIATLMLLVPSHANAVQGTIYFSPNGGTVIEGSSLTIDVMGNVPAPIFSGGATISVTYPTDLLRVTSTSSSGGALGGSKPAVNSRTGTIAFTAFNFFGRAVNNQMIFRVTFDTIATGDATLNFSSNTNINDGPTTKQPSTYAIQAPSCPIGQIGTPPNCTTPPPPSPSPSPTPTMNPSPNPTPSSTPTSPRPTATPPASNNDGSALLNSLLPTAGEETPEPTLDADGSIKISDVKTTVTRQKNTISWTVSDPAIIPTLTFGTSKTNQMTNATVIKESDGSFSATLPDLKLGALYYFTIKATSESKLQGATYNGTFTTRGYPVQLTIQQNGVLAPSAKVWINNRSFVANKDAIITTELGNGTYDASIAPAGSTTAYKASFTVQKKTIPANGNPGLQSFVLNITLANTGTESDNALSVIGMIVLVLSTVAGLASLVFYLRRRQDQQEPQAAVDSDLLAASYGTNFQEVRSNTPEPNLEAATLYQSSPLPALPLDDTSMTVPQTDQPQIPPPESIQDNLTIPTEPDGTNIDSLPLPPIDATNSGVSASLQQAMSSPVPEIASVPLPTTPVTTASGGYTEDEQLSPDLVQVEATEQIDDQEPSAVYDASTGELDIIHHHTATDASAEHPRETFDERPQPSLSTGVS